MCVGALPAGGDAWAADAVRLLASAGASPYTRDDGGRTALHWAAHHALPSTAAALLEAASAEAAAVAAKNAQAPAEGEEAAEQQALPPPLVEAGDKQGNTPLHAAARAPSHLLVAALLSAPGGPAAAARRNRAGQAPLHLAAAAGCGPAAAALAGAAPSTDATGGGGGGGGGADRRGWTPAAWAAKRGHAALAAALASGSGGPALAAAGDAGAPPPSPSSTTLIIAPDACAAHRTAPNPITRAGPDPPPENVHRLTVISHPSLGLLRCPTDLFGSRLAWREAARPATAGDVMRVHDWAYVRGLQAACASVPPGQTALTHLDGDTAVCHETFNAALVAAGAVIDGVDAVLNGTARHAFCAVRPPGHHAGPSGVVACANDPAGSHGFCLLNNVAIGAAYALAQYRADGRGGGGEGRPVVRRVAILDFGGLRDEKGCEGGRLPHLHHEHAHPHIIPSLLTFFPFIYADVHHGNGTQACVGGVAPSIARHAFVTPLSEGVQAFPTFKPWADFGDAESVFFASVQGYGHKGPAGVEGWVYPGSGGTVDSKKAAEGAGAAPGTPPGDGEGAAPAAAPAIIPEDPDGEFVSDPAVPASDLPPRTGPRIINVGIPGPGADAPRWRRAWRDKILPALARFAPDLVLISAGFDAHKKDDINFAYCGVTERDYAWVTEAIVGVANRSCPGRVVSVLEGGYRIQGGPVSAFARSVAAHVRSLAEANAGPWDPEDAAWERERERKKREEAAAAAAAADAEAEAAFRARLAAVEAAAVADAAAEDGPAGADGGGEAAVPLGGGGEEDGGRGGKRRRRGGGGGVDYLALNAQIEAEKRAAGGGG